MRVLWATCHRPDPSGAGGEAHEFALIRHASRSNEVVVVSSAFEPGETCSPLRELDVDVVGLGAPQRPAPVNRVSLFTSMIRSRAPMTVWRHTPCADALGAALGAEERRVRPDLIQVWPSEIAAVAAGRSCPVALILTDCFTRQAVRERALASTHRQQLYWSIEAHNARAWERTAFAAPAALGCVSTVDQETLHQLTGRPLDIIPVALGDEWFKTPAVPRSDADIVFVAALDYRPNVDAVEWLAQVVWPRIRERSPDARLHVVGRNPVPTVRQAVASCGAELHANVPDVRSWYWRAAVALSPVRLGSGMRNKILHAMACGAPLVATAASTEGIGGRDGVELLHADDPDAFAAAVHRLLSDRAAALQIAGRAAVLARNYGEDAVGQALDRLWTRARAV